MSTRKLTAVLVAGALLCLNLNTAIPAQVEKRPVLAVLPLHAVGVSEIEARQVTLHIIDHMERTGLFIVLEIAHIENALQDLDHGMFTRLDIEASIRAGKILSVDKAITGTLGQEDGTYVVTLEMIDIAAGRVEGKSSIRSNLGFRELPAAMITLLDPLIHPELAIEVVGAEEVALVASVKEKTPAEKKKTEEIVMPEEKEKELKPEEVKKPVVTTRPAVEPKAKKGKLPLILGVIAIAGAVVVVLLSKKKSDERGDLKHDIEMVYIPPGEFMMGSNEGYSLERPVHRVRITKGFWMGKYEVTQKQWRDVMGSNPSYFVKGDNYPVEQVTWDDVQSFIQKLNQLTGRTFRLPTEAEWEYACRAGTMGERYGDINVIAWYEENSGNSTQPVGRKQPNAFGLYDMLGNVFEWVQDWYDSSYYSRAPVDDPPGPESGSGRVFRGGSWFDHTQIVRAAFRFSYAPHGRWENLGFRLARTDL